MKRLLALLLASVLALSLLPAALAEEASYSEAPHADRIGGTGRSSPGGGTVAPGIVSSTTTLPPAT